MDDQTLKKGNIFFTFVLFLLLSSPALLLGQFAKVDSLENILEVTGAVEEKIKIHNSLAYNYSNNPQNLDLEKAKFHSKKSLELTDFSDAPIQRARAFFYLAVSLRLQDSLQVAIPYFQEALLLYETHRKIKYQAYCLQSLYFCHYHSNEQGRLDSVLSYAHQLVQIGLNKSEVPPGRVYDALLYLGLAYNNKGAIEKSNDYYLQAIAYSDTMNLDVAQAEYSLMLNYELQLDYPKMIETMDLAREKIERSTDSYSKAWIYFMVGETYGQMNDYANAKYYLAKAKHLADSTQNALDAAMFHFSLLYHNTDALAQNLDKLYTIADENTSQQNACHFAYYLSRVELILGDTTRAMEQLEKAEQLSYALNESYILPFTLESKAVVFLAQEKKEAALKNARSAYQIYKENNITIGYSSILSLLSAAEFANGNIKLGNRYYQQAEIYEDSIVTTRLKSIEKLSVQKVEEEKKNISLQKENIELKAQKDKRIFLILIGLALLFAALVIIKSLRDRRRLLRESNRLMGQINVQLKQLSEDIEQNLNALPESVKKEFKAFLNHSQSTQNKSNAALPASWNDTKVGLERLSRMVKMEHDFRDQLLSKTQQKEADLKAFNYSVSHDLKAPLNNTKLLLDRLENRIANRHMPLIKAELAQFKDLIHNMDGLIKGITEYAFFDHEAISVRPVNLNQLISRLIQVHFKPESSFFEQYLSVEDQLPLVLGDSFMLQTVFINVLSNAYKFTQHTQLPQVKIEGVKKNGQVTISVLDNGIGIPSEEQQNVFQLFKSAHDRAIYSGTGVGLAIVKRIIEKHGGRILVSSPGTGQGTCVRFTLEAANSKTAQTFR